MDRWSNCKMDTLYYSDAAEINEWCEVRLTENQIEVEYKRDGGNTYVGKNDGTGHFDLQANRYNGRASLHMRPDHSVLEGWWTEDDERGMWLIELFK
jgi:hypothetical protein